MTDQSVPVVSLYAEHAALFVLGVRTIETRSWRAPEKYIGQRMALQSAKRRPKYQRLGDYLVEPYYDKVRHVGDCDCEGTEVAPSCVRGSSSHMVLTRDERVVSHLPLGAIVATFTLAGVVPIVDGACGPGYAVLQVHADCLLGDDPFYDPRINRDFTDQFPYGVFRPDRFGWIFEDIQPVDPPVPFSGGQRLTKRWTPA